MRPVANTPTMVTYGRKRPRCLTATGTRRLLSLLVFASRASPGFSLCKQNSNDTIGLTDYSSSRSSSILRSATMFDGRKVRRAPASGPAFLSSSGMAVKAFSRSIHSRCDLQQIQEKARLESGIRRDDSRIMVEMTAYGDGGKGGWSGRPKTRRPLVFLAEAVNDAVLEMCVENQGRPLAMAITDVVERTIEAFVAGYSIEALLLELQMLDSTTRIPGETLTGVEKRYRTQWVGALHYVMQHLNFVEQREPKSAEDFHLKSQVDVVLRGRQTNDEQTFVKFDKALATGGVTGGVATELIVISPQMVPISQLILLAIRALQKLEDAAA